MTEHLGSDPVAHISSIVAASADDAPVREWIKGVYAHFLSDSANNITITSEGKACTNQVKAVDT